MDEQQDPKIEKEIAAVKELRKDIDALMLRVQKHEAEFGRSRARSLQFTHLELGKMYGGKRLEELGTPFPAELADKSTK